MPKRARPSVGDVFEVETPRGLVYGQVIHLNTQYGLLVRLIPRIYEQRPPLEELVRADSPPSLVWFFPLEVAYENEYPSVVFRPAGAAEVPPRWRGAPLFRMNEWDPERGAYLTDAAARNDGWVEMSRAEAEAYPQLVLVLPMAVVEQTLQTAGVDVSEDQLYAWFGLAGEREREEGVTHFVYFDDEELAKRAADALASRGDVELGRRGDAWLVKLRQPVLDLDEIDAIEALVGELGGNYDGHEFAL